MEQVHPLEAYRNRQVPPLTRQALADRLGVDRITVWRWENHKRVPDRELLPKVSSLTGIPVSALLGIAEAAE